MSTLLVELLNALGCVTKPSMAQRMALYLIGLTASSGCGATRPLRADLVQRLWPCLVNDHFRIDFNLELGQLRPIFIDLIDR